MEKKKHVSRKFNRAYKACTIFVVNSPLWNICAGLWYPPLSPIFMVYPLISIVLRESCDQNVLGKYRGVITLLYSLVMLFHQSTSFSVSGTRRRRWEKSLSPLSEFLIYNGMNGRSQISIYEYSRLADSAHTIIWQNKNVSLVMTTDNNRAKKKMCLWAERWTQN